MTATIYTTDTCTFCKTVEAFLKSRNVEYEKVDVTNDNAKRSELQKLTSYSTVPITYINGQYIVGWNPSKFMKAVSAL